MSAETIYSSLKPLYKSYNEVIKPLVAEIEARGQEFPLPLFNEIRAFNDHVAQCYWDDATDEKIKSETYKAERHITRIVLDCYKYLTLLLYDRVIKFEHQTKHIDLTTINNGLFYIRYRELRKKAEAEIRNAKKTESKDNGTSFDIFERAYNLYTDLETLIDDNMVSVTWARAKFMVRRIIGVLLWLLAAIFSGIISLLFTCDSVSQYFNSLIK